MNNKGFLTPMDQEDDIAPLVSNFFDNKDRYLDIDLGVFDFVLKCIDGPY